jgi:hypothetical protein
MDNLLRSNGRRHYAAVTNHIMNDPTPKDQAVYVPSISPGYAIDVYNRKWIRPLPDGLRPEDFDFLDPNNDFFRISHALYSAGQALQYQNRDCIVTRRDRNNTILICDSGGYQTATLNKAFNTDAERKAILSWLETNADYAITLDAPTAPLLERPDYIYRNYNACLQATQVHLKYFKANRSNTAVKFLNALHGNTPAEADHWYSAVRTWDFEGFAFAGRLRLNTYEMIRRLLVMLRDGTLEKVQWLHVLGTNRLDTAVLLTAIQRAIKKHLQLNIRISFDTSTPFLNLGYGTAVTLPKLEIKGMSIDQRDVPDGYQFIGSNVPWPWPSPLGNRMVMGDFCVPTLSGCYRDQQSNHYLAHHNLGALCWAIALANRVFDAEGINGTHTVGRPIGAAVEAIDKIFRSRSEVILSGYRSTFAKLRGFTE